MSKKEKDSRAITSVIISCPVSLAQDNQTLEAMPSQVRDACKIYEAGGRFNPNGYNEERKDTIMRIGSLWFYGTDFELKKRRKTLYITVKVSKESRKNETD